MFNVEKFQQGWREGEETWNLTEITARSGREGEIGVPRGSGIQGLSVLMALCFSPGITKILKNLSEFRIEDGRRLNGETGISFSAGFIKGRTIPGGIASTETKLR